MLGRTVLADRVEERFQLISGERFRQRDWSARWVKFQTLASTLRHVAKLVVIQSISSNERTQLADCRFKRSVGQGRDFALRI
jgi:hypothetical protein